MIRETLSAISLASHHALQRVTKDARIKTQVAHVNEWAFSMPHLSRITITNGPVHEIYVGLSQALVAALGPDPDTLARSREALLEETKAALLARMPARRPVISWAHLPADGNPRMLRGERSFILRHQAEAGNLYLMADVRSRREFESQTKPAWETNLAAEYLPHDIGRIDCIENRVMRQRMGMYLAQCEHDLTLVVPDGDGECHTKAGVVLRRQGTEDQDSLVISLDQRFVPEPGTEIEGSFGTMGRVVRFRTLCAGPVDLPLDGGGALSCVSLDLPRRFHLDQRRRYERVEPDSSLMARTAVLRNQDPTAEPSLTPPPSLPQCDVEDISFSGVGLRTRHEGAELLSEGTSVRVWLSGGDLERTLVVSGIVRRAESLPWGDGRQIIRLGIEFAGANAIERESIQHLRRYVMARQRVQLLNRKVAEPATSGDHGA